MQTCTHIDQIEEVTPSAQGCEACLKMGSGWVYYAFVHCLPE